MFEAQLHDLINATNTHYPREDSAKPQQAHLRLFSTWSALSKRHVTHNFSPLRRLRPIRPGIACGLPTKTNRFVLD